MYEDIKTLSVLIYLETFGWGWGSLFRVSKFLNNELSCECSSSSLVNFVSSVFFCWTKAEASNRGDEMSET